MIIAILVTKRKFIGKAGKGEGAPNRTAGGKGDQQTPVTQSVRFRTTCPIG